MKKFYTGDIVNINGDEYVVVDKATEGAKGAIFQTRRGGRSKFVRFDDKVSVGEFADVQACFTSIGEAVDWIVEKKDDPLFILQALQELNGELQSWDFDLNDEFSEENCKQKLIIILQHGIWQVVEDEQEEIETKTTEYAVVWVKEYKKEEVN